MLLLQLQASLTFDYHLNLARKFISYCHNVFLPWFSSTLFCSVFVAGELWLGTGTGTGTQC